MRDQERLEGQLVAAGRRFGIVASRFNSRVVEPLIDGALDCLTRHGGEAEAVRIVCVPGAWELPLALDTLAATGEFDALIALGVVIRGETPHFDTICAASSQGIAAVSARHGLPIGFGLLTCDTPQQAVERAGGKAGNKGWEAAMAAMEMADLLARLRPEADS